MSVSKTVAEDNSAAFPGMARIFTRTLLGEAYIEHIAGDLIYNAYAGPFLQALLNACADDGCGFRPNPVPQIPTGGDVP